MLSVKTNKTLVFTRRLWYTTRDMALQEPYYWYVLYVRTNAEKRVVEDMSRYIAERGFECPIEPFCPQSESYYRNKSERMLGKEYRRRPLFPGYIFAETQMPPELFITQMGDFIYRSTDIVRLLRMSGDASSIAVPTEERRRLEFLLTGKRCVEHSVGYIVGDRVCVNSGPLKDREGLITYINRHNRYADIEVELFGSKIKARVALEIVDKK